MYPVPWMEKKTAENSWQWKSTKPRLDQPPEAFFCKPLGLVDISQGTRAVTDLY